MTKLTQNQAQDIVDKMMNVIPYNVNIMSEKGIIIGSGDISRLNQFHEGAAKALALQKIIEVSNDDAIGTKPGVNMPIVFQDKVVGVIGITGNPEVVRPFTEIVRVTAELLINQEYVLNERKINERKREEYIYELTYVSHPYSKSFIERGLSLGIDLSLPRTAIILEFNEANEERVKNSLPSIIDSSEFFIKLNPTSLIVYMASESRIIKRLSLWLGSLKNVEINIGIGLKESIIADSVQEAQKALNIGKKLNPERNIFLYNELSFISTLADFKGNYQLRKIIGNLDKEGKQADLLNTLITYIRNNGEVNTTSDTLHIHRNTLTYRLEKIEELTGKSPKNFMDLLELFTAYIIYKL